MTSSDTTESYKDSAKKRITSSELKTLPLLMPGRFSHIFKTVDGYVLKCGSGPDRLSEAATMRYIQANTTIPIPEVLDAYLDIEDTTQGMLIMSYMAGDILEDVWPHLTDQAKASISSQLCEYVTQLRNIKGSHIGKIDHGTCEDPMFENDQSILYGPYRDEDNFNDGIIAAVRTKGNNVWIEMTADMVRCLQNHETVLTHGDLVPRNILVRNDQVVAILDWEMAGFWPEYWEYTKALYMPDWDDPWIKERITDKIMQPCHIEHAILRQVRDIFW